MVKTRFTLHLLARCPRKVFWRWIMPYVSLPTLSPHSEMESERQSKSFSFCSIPIADYVYSFFCRLAFGLHAIWALVGLSTIHYFVSYTTPLTLLPFDFVKSRGLIPYPVWFPQVQKHFHSFSWQQYNWEWSF